jgi:hypothetical protein
MVYRSVTFPNNTFYADKAVVDFIRNLSQGSVVTDITDNAQLPSLSISNYFKIDKYIYPEK